jgi:hypothetical protein
VEKITFSKFACFISLIVLLNSAEIVSLQAQENEDGQSLYSPQIEPTKITLGVVEDVVVSPWGLSFPARIDTGADLSSLDARDLVVRNNVAEFKLGKRWGGRRVQLPVTEWRHIQTAMGVEKKTRSRNFYLPRFKTLPHPRDIEGSFGNDVSVFGWPECSEGRLCS